MVGFYHVAGATKALRVVSHTHPPVGDWMVRAPGDEDLKRGGCCLRSTATMMEGKSGATVGSHKFFPLKTTTIFHCTIASCMPWWSLPWKRNEFPRQPCTASVPHHNKLVSRVVLGAPQRTDLHCELERSLAFVPAGRSVFLRDATKMLRFGPQRITFFGATAGSASAAQRHRAWPRQPPFCHYAPLRWR